MIGNADTFLFDALFVTINEYESGFQMGAESLREWFEAFQTYLRLIVTVTLLVTGALDPGRGPPGQVDIRRTAYHVSWSRLFLSSIIPSAPWIKRVYLGVCCRNAYRDNAGSRAFPAD